MNMVFEDMTKISQEEKLKYSEEFSEGSTSLKRLLLFLWDNKINTIACCAGHNIYDEPYISMSIDSLNKIAVTTLLSNIFFDYNSKVKVMIRNENNRRKKKDYLKHIIKLTLFFDYLEKESCFDYLLKVVNKTLTNELESKYDLLNEFNKNLIEDIVTVYSLDMKLYEDEDPFNDIVAIGIFDLFPNKFSITNRELYETKCFNKDKRTIISKNTYIKEDGRFFMYSEEGNKEVSLTYIQSNNIPSFDEIKGTNIYDYSHNSFYNKINELTINHKIK